MALRIVNQIGAEFADILANCGVAVEVIDMVGTATPWDLPQDTEVLVTRPMPVWRDCPADAVFPSGLRWVQTLSTGIESYPPALLQDRLVTCGRDLYTDAIADYVIAALLNATRPIEQLKVVEPGQWKPMLKIAMAMPTLAGQTLGLVGFGALGQGIARRAVAFGMKVVALRHGPWREVPDGLTPAQDLSEVLGAADHLVLAAPLTDETRHMMNVASFAAMRRGAHLVNISRGELVDQEALLAALDRGELGRATLDVTSPEPLTEGHPLYAHPDVLITPHVSWGGSDVNKGFAERFRTNLDAYVGDPAQMVAKVDLQRGY